MSPVVQKPTLLARALSIAKALVGWTLGAATLAVTYFPDDRNVKLYGGILLAALTGLGVLLTKNTPTARAGAVDDLAAAAELIPAVQRHDADIERLKKFVDAYLTKTPEATATPTVVLTPEATPVVEEPPAPVPVDPDLAEALKLIQA